MSFHGSTEWMHGWRCSDCWRQTVPPLAATTRNARSPSDDLLVAGTTSAGELDDLRRCLGSIRATCWSWSVVPYYVDTWMQGHRALYWILSWIRSQYRSFNTGMMWSAFLAWQTKRAVVLMTAWSRFELRRKANQQRITVIKLHQCVRRIRTSIPRRNRLLALFPDCNNPQTKKIPKLSHDVYKLQM